MKYNVSENIKDALAKLTGDAKVQEALRFIEEDQEEIIQKQIELTLIPAPTHQEGKKAARLLEMFEEEGLTDCRIDPYGNAVGIRRGTGGGKNVLVEGHMDTVFPLETELKIRRENGWIYCPGITDDTRGCASVLSVIRALNAAGIQTQGDIHFVGTVQEEGMGALKGMQYYVNRHPELDASVSIDGPGFSEITYEATGIQTYEFTFSGIGGHAAGAFGEVANPLAAAGRAVAKISDLKVPEYPRTTYAVTGAFAGSYESIHAIVNKAVILLNFRSDSQEELEKLRKEIFRCIEEACEEETARWGKDRITYSYRHVCDINAGTQPSDAPIVQAAMAIAEYLGCEEPELGHGGATNCSRALEAGLPAVCLGGGADYDSKCHTLQEQFKEEGAFRGCQSAFLLTLLCAGSDIAGSVIE
ncbi:MAG: M20/M25/M40 family metallo-hydrolase [Solobacterium sp.]|nr:M20/M25/M40 family metallo-hydrolase [Solobacterium sp.]